MRRLLLANGQEWHTTEPQRGWYLVREDASENVVREVWQLLHAIDEPSAVTEGQRVFRLLPTYTVKGVEFPRQPYVLYWAGRLFDRESWTTVLSR